ncbi:MAG TPA: ribosome-associated translation inhibitor RaiA [Leptospiraceae bacterium]|nr:ribosome-associated translation inhibitor RaiA [Leptospiraceae bacterium]
MEIAYHFHNLEVSEAMKDYASKKIEKLSANFRSFLSAMVRFRVEKIRHQVEFTLNGDGVQFIATEEADSMYEAIDLAEKKLEKQLKKHKDKQQGKHHRV